jgi:YidC/Oxa1 family membrane protein insertase
MFDLIARVLAFFYAAVHSYGLSIALLTLVVMAVTTPFTLKGTKSMIQMQRLQPQLKAIQTKYRDDREKMNQELMAFYKANNINPIGGCLPLFIQIPVFWVLYRVVRGLTARVTDVGLQAGISAMNLQQGGQQFGLDTTGKRTFNPSYISDTSKLHHDLSASTQMKSWGIDLAESASSAVSRSIGHALPYLFLILLVAITGIIQQRQIQGRQSANAHAAPVNSQQQMIMKIMPFFLPIFSFGMPAGLVVYFVVSNMWRIGQQAFITRTLYNNPAGMAPVAPIEVIEVESPKSSEPAAKPKAATPARSPMGRNRREGAEAAKAPARAARKPKVKKSEPAAPVRPSGRVTPPGSSGSRARKKKRN